MKQVAEKIEKIAANRRSWLASETRDVPGWLQRIRDLSFANFCQLGVPSRRMENFKYSKIPPMDNLFLHAHVAADSTYSTQNLTRSADDNAADLLLRFTDGKLLANSSEIRQWQALGLVKHMDISSVAPSGEEWESTLDSFAASGSDSPFYYLSGSYLTESTRIQIPSNWKKKRIIIEHQIGNTTGLRSEASNLSLNESQPADGQNLCRFVSPTVFIDIAPDSEIVIVERFLNAQSQGESSQFANATVAIPVTNVKIGNSARVAYHVFTHNLSGTLVALDHQFTLEQKSDLQIYTAHINAQNIRHDLLVSLNGEEASAKVDGIYFAGSQQTVDNNTLIRHIAPRTKSQQFYKSLIGKNGRGAFTGRIEVRREAVGCQAIQLNKNLLLDDEAEANTRPQLAISTDDIKCTHGATIGQLDDLEIFYLQTRGINGPTARKMLSQAFADEIIMGMPDRATAKTLRTASQQYLEFLFTADKDRKPAPSPMPSSSDHSQDELKGLDS